MPERVTGTLPGSGGGSVLRSASSSILKPMTVHGMVEAKKGTAPEAKPVEDDDPIMAVMNRKWTQKRVEAPEPVEIEPVVLKRDLRKRRTIANHELDPSSSGVSRNASASDGDKLRARLGAQLAGVDTKATRGEESPKDVEQSPVLASLLGAGMSPDSPLLKAEAIVPRKTGNVGAGGRRWSISIASEHQGSDSPKWTKAMERRASSKLGVAVTLEANAEEAEGRAFEDVASKLQTVISNTCVRMNDHMGLIREQYKKEPEMYDLAANHERLVELSFNVATVNYYLSKWLNQLDSKKYPKPQKPSSVEECMASEILSDVQGGIARMDTKASELAPQLQKIVKEAKSLRRTPTGEPATPTLKDPSKLAAKRGIADVKELETSNVVSHCERILEVCHALAYLSQAKPSQVKTSINVLKAVGRFKKNVGRSSLPVATVPPGGETEAATLEEAKSNESAIAVEVDP